MGWSRSVRPWSRTASRNQSTSGEPADDVAYWDVVAALSTPPTIGWFADAVRDQGRTDLDRPALLRRRDAFLRTALARLG